MKPLPALLLPLLLLGAAPAQAADPDALWQIVHDKCEPDEQANHRPEPCAVLDESGGFAVLKDIRGAEQYLLIPTARISGIESPALLQAGTPNYFADAWSEMSLVQAALRRELGRVLPRSALARALPREDLSLAINSAYGRSQDQLHIHMECISRPVHDALLAQLGSIGAGWTELRTPLAGHRYRALRIDGEQLGDSNPFHLLAASLADPARSMGRHTLVLVGADLPRPGFVLLDGKADLLRLDRGSGEALQDHSCTIAQGMAPARSVGAK